MNIEEFNRKFIYRYLSISKKLRSNNSYPFLIEFEKSLKTTAVPIYFKQPQDWLSSCYGVELSPEELYEKLMTEYNVSLTTNSGFKPIQIFQKYKNRLLKEQRDILLIYNNIIKFSQNSQKGNPDSFDGPFVDKFNDFFEEEYKIIQPSRSIFCIGPHVDYTGLMSWKILDDTEIVPITQKRPFWIYKDKFGNKVLHTFHPSYWFKINVDLESIVYDFIIGKNIDSI